MIAKTVQATPPNATHWSRALVAEAMDISPSSVGRYGLEAGLKPHITKGFTVLNDPMFEEKVIDIVGLYLDPSAREVLKFLRHIHKVVPANRDIHLVLDNYATRKTPDEQPWLNEHPRFKLHFTPTSTSWLNLVERVFTKITSRRVRRGSYSSFDDL